MTIEMIEELLRMLPCGIDEYSDIHYMKDNRDFLKAALSVFQKMAKGDAERERFERQYSDNTPDCASIRRNGDGYRLMQSQSAWEVWQACKADNAKHIAMLLEQEMK